MAKKRQNIPYVHIPGFRDLGELNNKRNDSVEQKENSYWPFGLGSLSTL